MGLLEDFAKYMDDYLRFGPQKDARDMQIAFDYYVGAVKSEGVEGSLDEFLNAFKSGVFDDDVEKFEYDESRIDWSSSDLFNNFMNGITGGKWLPANSDLLSDDEKRVAGIFDRLRGIDGRDAYESGVLARPYLELLAQGLISWQMAGAIFARKDLTFNDKLSLFRIANNFVNEGKYQIKGGGIGGYGGTGGTSGFTRDQLWSVNPTKYWSYSKFGSGVGDGQTHGWMKSKNGDYFIRKNYVG